MPPISEGLDPEGQRQAPYVSGAVSARGRDLRACEEVDIVPATHRRAARRWTFPAIRRLLAHVVEEVLPPALRAAGIDTLRPELSKGMRRWLVAHDCRATYVTLKAALGVSERHIMVVTGHMTSKEITTYHRQSTQLQTQIRLGRLAWLEPLDVLLGLRAEASSGAGGVAQGVARVIQLSDKKASRRSPAWTSGFSSQVASSNPAFVSCRRPCGIAATRRARPTNATHP
jgi:hypothetical protein